MDNLSDGAGNGGFCGKDAWKFSVADSLGDRCGHLVPLVSVGQEEYPDRVDRKRRCGFPGLFIAGFLFAGISDFSLDSVRDLAGILDDSA